MTARRSARTRAPPAPVTDHVVPAAPQLALPALGGALNFVASIFVWVQARRGTLPRRPFRHAASAT